MFRTFAFLMLILGLAGCADTAQRLYRVTGKVMWQGKPLESGQINFVDIGGQTTPASAKIVDGHFEIRTTQGLKTIMVYNQRDLGFNKAMNQHVFTNDVPAEYNARSKLQFEVQPNDNNVYEVGLPQKK
ncbi:MAG: hypothetical protein C0467_07165 [Planctomycetaceae bacterium]|nr:hypothetical protein [Planctomycetaceae bacterium]